MDHTLLINFIGDGKNNSITVKNPTVVPRIGDAIHNQEDSVHYYIVTDIDWFFSDSYTTVVINAGTNNKKNLKNI